MASLLWEAFLCACLCSWRPTSSFTLLSAHVQRLNRRNPPPRADTCRRLAAARNPCNYSRTTSETGLSSKDLIEHAEGVLDSHRKNVDNERGAKDCQRGCDNNDPISAIRYDEIASRRLFLASVVCGGGMVIGGGDPTEAASLQWEQTPVNKRYGVTVFDAEKDGYNVAFVTYLSRFLLVFDEDCQRWWYARGAELPRLAKKREIEAIRLEQFASFSASVEVGLQFYNGVDGPKRLMESLLKRYCPDLETLRANREIYGLPPLTENAEAQQLREIKEARRQIALLFGLMEKNQPVEELTKLLAAVDGGRIESVEISDPGSGYAPGYGVPYVRFPPPEAGKGYVTAAGRAVLRPNGKILRFDVVNRGFGYIKAPTVTVSPPKAMMKIGGENESGGGARAAEAKAFLFKGGVNKGRVERIQLVDPGAGYVENEVIKVKVSPPEMSTRDGGVTATATAVLEYEVGSITIVNPGSGYAVERPVDVYVEPPPLTARVNMNDPMVAQLIPADQLLPPTTNPTKEMKKKMQNVDGMSLSAQIQKLASNDGLGGAGGCIGRACYDRPVVATAYPRSESSSYSSFRSEDDAMKSSRMEASLERNAKVARAYLVSGSGESTSGPGSANVPALPSLGSGVSAPAQLLSLLPAGIGLQFDETKKRFIVRATPEILDNLPSGWFDDTKANRPFDPEFGPRGRSPIEREKVLGIDAYLRFAASGAICCSGVHLALTPIDVVKTKVQSNPKEYPGVIQGFQKLLDSGGPAAFFTGWVPTFVGFFVWGGVAFALTEYCRRVFTAMAGLDAASLEVPIILAAATVSAIVGSFILCPFEAVRIRSVALSGQESSIVKIFNKMLEDEGLLSLFSAVPVFLAKEIPFNTAKFTIFDLSTALMYDVFPVAREDLQLSLLVSLAGGTLGGAVAAIVSNPADATITEMKKSKSDLSPLEIAQNLWETGGPRRFLAGVSLRMVFYALIVSLQFLVYDAVRFALGIGSDDLKLYLDVLGGALKGSS